MEGPYLLGIDGGTEGLRVGIFDRWGWPAVFADESYATTHQRPGWAEQSPKEWWASLVAAVRRALDGCGVAPEEIAGISLDATTCTVVAVDEKDRVLRPAILWMDVRAADQARRISQTGHEALKYCGYDNISAEWMPSKALWLKENEPETYTNSARICEYLDWMTHRLTGEWTASISTASARWLHDRDAGGFPEDLFDCVGIGELVGKLPPRVLDLGVVVGGLRREAARELGLPEGIPVAEGGADAWVATLGLDVLEPGKTALITGSSHCMLAQAADPVHGRGFFGSYTDSIVPGQYTIEGGQVSTGSVIRWFRDRFCGGLAQEAKERGRELYDLLNERAAKVPSGSEGLIFLDYFQGNRTPHTDPEARGMIWGLSLRHDAEHVYRAMLEGICYGTEHVFRILRESGYAPKEIVACGGPTKSELWMQLHADISNLPISLTRCSDGAAALGSAILGAVGAGIYPDMHEAARNMVHTERTVEPNPERHEEYRFYADKYIKTYPQMRELMSDMARHVAGGGAVPREKSEA